VEEDEFRRLVGIAVETVVEPLTNDLSDQTHLAENRNHDENHRGQPELTQQAASWPLTPRAHHALSIRVRPSIDEVPVELICDSLSG
jgi:hypothetical protein